MEYEWDRSKAAASLIKHGVAFEEVTAFEWERGERALIERDNRYPYGEARYYALGKVRGRVYAVIHTMRGKTFRMISFRKANKRERRRYEKG